MFLSYIIQYYAVYVMQCYVNLILQSVLCYFFTFLVFLLRFYYAQKISFIWFYLINFFIFYCGVLCFLNCVMLDYFMIYFTILCTIAWEVMPFYLSDVTFLFCFILNTILLFHIFYIILILLLSSNNCLGNPRVFTVLAINSYHTALAKVEMPWHAL